jgi:type VI secretion system protein ImpG
MDPRQLEHYLHELRYITESAHEFGQNHPKIARRLGISESEIADPYVQRLLEAFAFVASRQTMRLDDEFQAFTHSLLNVVHSNYTTLTPSITLARAFPLSGSKYKSEGLFLPRGTVYSTPVENEEQTACQFVSSQDVVVFPLVITEARLTGVPADIPSLYRHIPGSQNIRGALRMTLQTIDSVPISSLAGLDRLPVYLAGEESIASHLFELIHTAAVSTVIGLPGELATGTLHTVKQQPVTHEALEPEQSLLPRTSDQFHGHNLVQEYFIAPWRFWFFTLTGLRRAFCAIEGNTVEIVLLLDRPVGELANQVDASDFALYCTPLINLFDHTISGFELESDVPETLITPVRERPNDYELHSIVGARAQMTQQSAAVPLKSLHAALHGDFRSDTRYFALRRERSLVKDNEREHSTLRPLIETRTYFSLVDRNGYPLDERFGLVTLDALLTNRDLPCLIPRNGKNDVEVDRSLTSTHFGLVRAPTMPQPPMAWGKRAWELYGQLSLPYDMFDEAWQNEPEFTCIPGEGVRSRLRLCLPDNVTTLQQHIEAIVRVEAKPVNCFLSKDYGQPYGRAIECTVTVDETRMNGMSAYTLGLVLERYFARSVSAHSHTTTVLESVQRGRITQWPPRRGWRGVA